MRNFWLSYMYFYQKENCYMPRGWEILQDRPNTFARIRNPAGHVAGKINVPVIIETETTSDVEQELRDIGLIELTRNFSVLKEKNITEVSKIPIEDRNILDNLMD